jgi:hypothetical protein
MNKLIEAVDNSPVVRLAYCCELLDIVCTATNYKLTADDFERAGLGKRVQAAIAAMIQVMHVVNSPPQALADAASRDVAN